MCKLHLRHVTGETTSHSTMRADYTREVAGYGEDSRSRELQHAAHPAPECFATPCQSVCALTFTRLVLPSLATFFSTPLEVR